MSRNVTYYFTVDSSGAVQGAGEAEDALEGVEQQSDSTGAAAVAMGTVMASAFSMIAGQIASLPGAIFSLSTEVEETASKFNTVFGPAAQDVTGFLEENARMMGLTTHEARGLLAGIGDLTEGFGFTKEEAASTSTEVLSLAADISSFQNIDTEQAINAITSGLTGETEALKSLGIVLRQADVEQRALTQTGKESAEQLTQQERATASLSLITERAASANGDLERTQDSAANRSRRLQAEIRELGQSLAERLLPSVSAVIGIGTAFMNTDIFQGMVSGAEAAIDVTNIVLSNLDSLMPAIQGTAGALGIAGLAWLAYRGYVMRATLATKAHAVATAAATGGLTLIIAAFGALAGVLLTSEEGWSGLKNVVMGFWEFITTFFSNLPTAGADAMDLLFEVMTLPMQQVFNFWNAIFTSMTENFSSLVSAFTALMRGDFSGAWDIMKDVAVSTTDEIVAGFSSGLEGIDDAATALFENTDFSGATARMSEGAAQIAGAFADTFSFTMQEAQEEGKLDLIPSEERRELNQEQLAASLAGLNLTRAEYRVVNDEAEQEALDGSLQRLISNNSIREQEYNEDAASWFDAHMTKREASAQTTAQIISSSQQQVSSLNDVMNATKNAIRDSIEGKIKEAAATQFAWVISSVPWPFNIGLAMAASAGISALLGSFLPFREGGLVPVRVSNGEYAFDPETTRQFGPALEAANANPSVAAGLSGLIQGPGTGTSDSIPTVVEEGSFIMNAASTAAMLGRKDGGYVTRQLISGGGSSRSSSMAGRLETMLVGTLNRLEERLGSLEVGVRGKIRNETIYLSNDMELEKRRETLVTR